MKGVKGEWHEIIDPLAKRFEVAAAVGGETVWNAKGSAAMAKLLRTMAEKLDTEIERQKVQHEKHDT